MRIARAAALLCAAAAIGPAAALEAFITEQSGQSLSVVDLVAGEVAERAPLRGAPAGVAVGIDRDVWVTSPESAELHRIDRDTLAVISIPLEGAPFGVAVDPVSGRVYVSDWHGDRVFLVEDGIRVGEIATGRSPSGVAVTSDGSLLLSADQDSDQVSIFDVKSRRPIATVAVGARPFGVTIDEDDRLAYTADVGSDTVSVIDIERGARIAAIPVGARPYEVALAGNVGFVTNYGDSVTAFDLATHDTLGEIEVGEYPEGIEASADGERVYVANWFSNTLSIIDAATREVVGEIEVGDGPRAFGDFLGD